MLAAFAANAGKCGVMGARVHDDRDPLSWSSHPEERIVGAHTLKQGTARGLSTLR